MYLTNRKQNLADTSHTPPFYFYSSSFVCWEHACHPGASLKR